MDRERQGKLVAQMEKKMSGWITNEMAERVRDAQERELARRLTKLKRFRPDASPYTNLYAPWLDWEPGDPEPQS